MYNSHMGGLTGQPSFPVENESRWRATVIGVVLVVAVIGIIVLLSRGEKTTPTGPPPYASKLKLSDLKLSAAQNFVGATVTYLDGNISNTGDKTVTGVTVEAIFKNSMGQVAQKEDLPLHVLQTGGPYADVADLAAAPLAPGRTRQFRLTVEGAITTDWNQQYPELRITHVTTK
ncbi:MAG TPA: hypothetical protein VE994_20235 [Terriglobales bacterium]|nr:hypothetical protein [Terriglobales bacterium]